MSEVVHDLVAVESVAPTRLRRTFAALERPAYRLLWWGSVFSFLSIQMQIIARGWLAFDLTGSNKGLGAVYLGFGVPMLLLTPWGGVAADRISKRLVIVVSQLALGLSSLIIGVAISTDVIDYWMLIASAVLQGAGFSFLGPSRMAFTAELAGRDRLANAIVLQQMSMNSTRVIGPSLAGVLIGVHFFGIAGVYYLTSALMLLALTTTLRLPLGAPHPDRDAAPPRRELADGARYVLHRKPLLLLVGTSFVVVMFAFPYIAFLPTVAADVFGRGASSYGIMSGVSAIGALLASLYIAGRAGGPSAWKLQMAAGAGFGCGVALLGVAPSFAVALLVILVTGGASSGFQSLNNALVLGQTDERFHGRVQSLMMLSFSGFGMAALPLGAVADAIGIRTTLVIMGAVATAAVAACALLRWRMEDR